MEEHVIRRRGRANFCGAQRLADLRGGLDVPLVDLDGDDVEPLTLLPWQVQRRSDEQLEACRRLFAATLLRALVDAGLAQSATGGRPKPGDAQSARAWLADPDAAVVLNLAAVLEALGLEPRSLAPVGAGAAPGLTRCYARPAQRFYRRSSAPSKLRR